MVRGGRSGPLLASYAPAADQQLCPNGIARGSQGSYSGTEVIGVRSGRGI